MNCFGSMYYKEGVSLLLISKLDTGYFQKIHSGPGNGISLGNYTIQKVQQNLYKRFSTD